MKTKHAARDVAVVGVASALMIDEEDKQAQMVLERNYFVEALEEATPAVLGYGDGNEE